MRLPYTSYEVLSKSWMFLELFLFAKNMKFLTKGGSDCISRSSRGTFILCAGYHWSNWRSMITVLLISWYIVCTYMYCCIHNKQYVPVPPLRCSRIYMNIQQWTVHECTCIKIKKSNGQKRELPVLFWSKTAVPEYSSGREYYWPYLINQHPFSPVFGQKRPGAPDYCYFAQLPLLFGHFMFPSGGLYSGKINKLDS